MDLGMNIKRFRLASGLTLLEVAKRLGVQEATVQRYESGKIKNLKYNTIVALADIFGITPQELMGWDEEEDAVKDFTDKFNTMTPEEKADVMRYIDFVISKR